VNTYNDYLAFEAAAHSGQFDGATVFIDDLTEVAEMLLTEELPKTQKRIAGIWGAKHRNVQSCSILAKLHEINSGFDLQTR